jgi:hypothetical protein
MLKCKESTMMIDSQSNLKKVEAIYSMIACEMVTAKEIGGALYVFGSELGTLRIFRKCPHFRQNYSTSMSSFYVIIKE